MALKDKLTQTPKTLAKKTKAHYQQVLSATLIVTLILIVYGHDLEILYNEALQSEAFSHILLMPFLAGFLLYLKRDMVKAALTLKKQQKTKTQQYIDEITGIALILIAFLIYWYGSYTFYPLEYHLFSLPIFAMGITLILFNLKTLTTLIFPILFLLFLTPPPAEFTFTAGSILGNINTEASYQLLKTLGLPVTLSTQYGPPAIILTSTAGQPATFTVDLACSGIYSLTAFLMFAVFMLFIVTGSIPKKITLFILGFTIIETLSIIRISGIITIAYLLGGEIAMLVFHSVAGLVLIFAGVLITLFMAEKLLKMQVLPKQQKQPPCPECKTTPHTLESFCANCGKFFKSFNKKISTRFWAKLAFLMLGCSILTLSIHAPTFALAKETIEATAGWEKAENVFPQTLNYTDANYTLRFYHRDTAFERIARQDAALVYAYLPNNMSKTVVYVLANIANTISNLHSWEVCLITWQTAQGRYPLVTTLQSKDVQLLPDTTLIARYLVFHDTRPANDYIQLTLYWFERATFRTGITVEQKYVRISLVIIQYDTPNYPTKAQQLENELLNIGQDIARAWQPLKTQALISLGVPAQQILLITSIGFVAFTKTAQHLNDWKKKNNNQKIFNNFATAEEKHLLQTIQNLAKQNKKLTTNDIHKATENNTKTPTNPTELLKKLNHLEEYDFIKKDITSLQNRPQLIWKTR